MRIIRSVRTPNTILLHEFQKSRVNKSSTVRLHPVLIEASSVVNGGKSYSASAPSDVIEARKPQRRISKNERKSMVENYVKTYRETNAGKFPSVRGAIRNAGGSYYTVRQILQELIYSSKQPLMDAKETSLKKNALKKDEISANIEEVSQTGDLGEVMKPISKEDIGDSTSKIIEKQGQQSSVSVETDKSVDVGTQFHHLIGKPESSQHPDPENHIKWEKLKNKLPQETAEISRREFQKVLTGDSEPQNNLSLWNNLKSFANGILSLWKRS